MSEYDWIIGIGVSFGLALLFSSLTFKNLQSFLLFLTMFTGFFVYAGVLDLWILIMCIIADVIVVYTSIKGFSSNSEGAL